MAESTASDKAEYPLDTFNVRHNDASQSSQSGWADESNSGNAYEDNTSSEALDGGDVEQSYSALKTAPMAVA